MSLFIRSPRKCMQNAIIQDQYIIDPKSKQVMGLVYKQNFDDVEEQCMLVFDGYKQYKSELPEDITSKYKER